MTSKLITSFAAAAVSLVLVACGGGGGGSSISSTPTPEVPPVAPPAASSPFPMGGASAIVLTGALPPQDTVADQHDGRALGILERADSLLLTSSYGESSDPEFSPSVTKTECSGTSCAFLDVDGTTPVTRVDNYDYRPAAQGGRAMLSKHGITTLFLDETWEEVDDNARVDDDDYGFRAYGAWMNNAAFFLLSLDSRFENGEYAANVTDRFGLAQGELTGSRPTATATWQGLMVGTPQFGDNKFNVLQGDATLAFDMSSMTIDVAFTDIKDLDLNAAHSAPSVRFDDLPVAGDGTFGGVEGPGHSIQGGFYGSGHAETAGVFEQAGIVGAFGARRQ